MAMRHHISIDTMGAHIAVAIGILPSLLNALAGPLEMIAIAIPVSVRALSLHHHDRHRNLGCRGFRERHRAPVRC
ncbi:hypothetical protein [Mesorhizobium sp. CAU 1732]|uniref:hypothetical protein n=1 Tax=Mesorhizobium sp. CAU 1732 TaxID=3140358 RepID=UPI003260E235